MKVQFELERVAEISAQKRDEMFDLFRGHFPGVTRDDFTRDLMEKDLALVLFQNERLVGFSTLAAWTTTFESEQVNVIYSGDTIVTPDAWGSPALPRAWVAGVAALRAMLPPVRCFWLLLTSGFRTYRFLPVFWREFNPRYDSPTPPEFQRMLDQFARERFGSRFHDGIVRFDHPQQLRPDLQQIPEARQSDPHVAFFLSRNPGHGNGDELVSITEICSANLTAAGRRMMPSDAPLSNHR